MTHPLFLGFVVVMGDDFLALSFAMFLFVVYFKGLAIWLGWVDQAYIYLLLRVDRQLKTVLLFFIFDGNSLLRRKATEIFPRRMNFGRWKILRRKL